MSAPTFTLGVSAAAKFRVPQIVNANAQGEIKVPKKKSASLLFL